MKLLNKLTAFHAPSMQSCLAALIDRKSPRFDHMTGSTDYGLDTSNRNIVPAESVPIVSPS